MDIAFISDDMYNRYVETIPAFREPMLLVTRPDSPLPAQVHPTQLDVTREIRMRWNPEYDLWHSFWFGSSSTPRMWFDQMSLMEEAILWEDCWLIAPASVVSALVQSGQAKLHTIQSGPPERIIYYLLGPRRKHLQTQRLLTLLQSRLEEMEGVTSLLSPPEPPDGSGLFT